jgi:hypothetical protein
LGATVNPVGSVTAASYARPAVTAIPAAAVPRFAARQTANASTDIPGARAPPPSANPNIARTITIDPQSREVIYRVIDMRISQVLLQVPDVALSRCKAYLQTPTKASRPLKNQINIKE